MPDAEEHKVLLVELNNGEYLNSKLVRVKQNTILRFACGKEALGRRVRLTVTVYNVDHIFEDLTRLDLLDVAFDLLCDKFGSFKYEFFIEDAEKPSGWGYFSVIPRWTIGDQEFSLNSLCVCTHLTKLLGPLSEWEDRLRVAKEAGYNVIHLTPVQTLGISNSSYSIADFHALNPSLGKDVTFEELANFVNFMHDKWSVLTIHDVVWNHAARNSLWLREHPECAFNCVNSPHLRPAFILDQALKLFSDEVAESDWDTRGLPVNFCESVHVESLRAVLAQEVLPKLKLHEFFQVDVEKLVDEFKKRCTGKEQGVEGKDDDLHIIQDPLYRRFGSTVNLNVAVNLFYSKYVNGHPEIEQIENSAELLRRKLDALNHEKYLESLGHIDAILNATMGHVHYERVDLNGPRIPLVEKHKPLTTNYFVCDLHISTWEEAERIAYDEKDGQMVMACNGWIMSCDPMKNFAESDSQVYLRRELVSWGDSIKLNYGEKPDDCPFLWNYMKEYTEKCARIFHGVRIDNAHSTPMHVAEYFLNAARAIRPNLYTVAELFTGSEDLDHIFVNHLGITSLIREAQNAPDSHEQGRFVYRYGGDAVGAFRKKDVHPALSNVAHALFYDQTHDNPSPVQKRTAYDFVPTASMCSIAYCASASSRGYDEFIPFHIHVVNEKRLYRKWSEIQNNPNLKGLLEARRLFNNLHVELCAKGFSEIFVDQYNEDVVAITRHNPLTHESVLLIAHCAFGDFKWQPVGHEHKGIPVADELVEILFEVKTIEQPNDAKITDDDKYLTGLQNMGVEIYEHVSFDKSLAIEVVGNVIKFKNFPSGSVVALKINPRPETVQSCKTIDDLIGNDVLKNDVQNLVRPLDAQFFNYLLYRSEKEEQVENGSDSYDVPNFGKFVYCGLKGIENVIRKIQEQNDLGHPVCSNIREGTWLAFYIVNRLRRFDELQKLADRFENAFKPLDTMPHFLRPCYFELIFSYLYYAIEEVLVEKIGSMSKLPYNVKIIKSLGLLSVSFVASIKDALLPPLHQDESISKHPPSLAAGLPHFACGIWRNWGRDTFIALPGILLTNSRFVEARQLILAYAGTLRHGLIPNLLAEGKAARYNCRDAVWFWLASIVKYIEKSDEGAGILNAHVLRLYPTDDAKYSIDKVEPLHATMYEALFRHFEGIHFRERSAGHQIDEHMKDEGFNVSAWICHETGFVFGGNPFNCGTWMDKMGSSDRANNRGLPATPRDGAAVELQGLALFVAEHLDKLHSEGHFPHDSLATKDEKWSWKEWSQKIRQNFEQKFFVSESCTDELVNKRNIVKDSYGSSHRYADFQLRPNFCITLKLVPDILPLEKSLQALEIAGRVLDAPLGICTLDPEDWNYNGDYFNDKDDYDQKTAKGWNYHQGPEWLWVLGEYLSAKLRVSHALKNTNPSAYQHALAEVKDRIYRFSQHIKDSPWSSLPELTNRNGSFCPGSCPSQAWSVGCFTETLEILNQQFAQQNTSA